jgi:glycine cleavage system H lipoate-binding protein
LILKQEVAMKHSVSELKKKKDVIDIKGLKTKRFIGPDLPFAYDDIASVTSSEYVRSLQRDGIAVLPNEELKRNIAGFLLKTIEYPKRTQVSGFMIADEYYHHIGHSWVQRVQDGWVRVGIDDFTSKVFGPADTIGLPGVGDFLMQGEVGWIIIRNDRKAPIQSPVSGIVCAVNDKVREQPRITYKDPYGEGWLFFLNPVSLEISMKELRQGTECFRWIEEEKQNLLELLGPRYEQLVATGGGMIDDIFGHFPEIGWDRLVRTFLG